MVKAIALFLEFCYLVRRHVLDDDDLEKLDDVLSRYLQEREIFRTTGVRSTGFDLPRQHALCHYRDMIMMFGAPNGLCSSITESKHIKAVRKPWRRSSRFNALSQMLLTNQRLDKLAACTVDFRKRGMLDKSIWANNVGQQPPATANDDDADCTAVDDREVIYEVKLAVDTRTLSFFYTFFMFTSLNSSRRSTQIGSSCGLAPCSTSSQTHLTIPVSRDESRL